jgi:hypothetical protein
MTAPIVRDLGKYMGLRWREAEREWWLYNRQNGASLGRISRYVRWRQWVFTPDRFGGELVLAASCLREIAGFLTELNAGRIAPLIAEARET